MVDHMPVIESLLVVQWVFESIPHDGWTHGDVSCSHYTAQVMPSDLVLYTKVLYLVGGLGNNRYFGYLTWMVLSTRLIVMIDDFSSYSLFPCEQG